MENVTCQKVAGGMTFSAVRSIVMNDQQQDILHLFAEQIRKQFGDHLKQLILFGSRARGDHAPDADYDCVAILDEVPPDVNDLIDELAGDFLYEYNAVFSVFPISEERHATQSDNPFLRNIGKEGILL